MTLPPQHSWQVTNQIPKYHRTGLKVVWSLIMRCSKIMNMGCFFYLLLSVPETTDGIRWPQGMWGLLVVNSSLKHTSENGCSKGSHHSHSHPKRKLLLILIPSHFFFPQGSLKLATAPWLPHGPEISWEEAHNRKLLWSNGQGKSQSPIPLADPLGRTLPLQC